jgi:hypothetical protein
MAPPPDNTDEEVETPDPSGESTREPVYGDEDFDFESWYEGYEKQLSGDEPAEKVEEPEEESDEPTAEEPTVGGESGEESGPEPELPATIRIGQYDLTPEDAERLAATYKWMSDYPEEATKFAGYLSGAYEMYPVGTEPAPQEPEKRWDADDDENWAFVPDALKQKVSKLDELEERMAQYEQYLAVEQDRYMAAARAQAESSVTSGIAKFREEYDITDTEVDQLRSEAAQLGVVPALNAQYNDPVRATYEALELAYLRNPDYRQREMDRKLQELQVDNKRQRKLASIGGQGGTAPAKQPKVPSTPDEMREAMVRDIAEAINGS